MEECWAKKGSNSVKNRNSIKTGSNKSFLVWRAQLTSCHWPTTGVKQVNSVDLKGSSCDAWVKSGLCTKQKSVGTSRSAISGCSHFTPRLNQSTRSDTSANMATPVGIGVLQKGFAE